MPSRKVKNSISALHVNGMNGRMMRLSAPAGKKREILLLYGHHASLERMNGLAEVLNDYGAVTMPDLPGLGGMTSFYSIGEKPTLDNYADYLASLIKLRYKRRRFTIIAMSFSVPLITRTLQKYPELAKKVDIVVSVAGFVHRDDFIFSKSAYWGLRTLSYVFEKRLPAMFMGKVLLKRPVIKSSYVLTSKNHSKMKDALDVAERDRRIDFEIGLWKMNDVRTRMSTMTMMFTMDLCADGRKVDLPIYHVTASADRYFDNEVVKQHLHVIYKSVHMVTSEMPNHAPSIMATAKEAAPYIPKQIRKLLR